MAIILPIEPVGRWLLKTNIRFHLLTGVRTSSHTSCTKSVSAGEHAQFVKKRRLQHDHPRFLHLHSFITVHTNSKVRPLMGSDY